MGVNDRKRFKAFAEFVHETFPQAKTIADVGGSHGKLSFFLHKLGHDPTIIDTRKLHLPRRMHKELRKKSAQQGRLIEIPRVVQRVQDIDLQPFDLIVALHPDEATEPAIRSAIEFDKDFAVVPCCVFPIDGIKRSRDQWQEYLTSLAPDIVSTELPVYGANTVLYRCKHLGPNF